MMAPARIYIHDDYVRMKYTTLGNLTRQYYLKCVLNYERLVGEQPSKCTRKFGNPGKQNTDISCQKYNLIFVLYKKKISGQENTHPLKVDTMVKDKGQMTNNDL